MVPGQSRYSNKRRPRRKRCSGVCGSLSALDGAVGVGGAGSVVVVVVVGWASDGAHAISAAAIHRDNDLLGPGGSESRLNGVGF